MIIVRKSLPRRYRLERLFRALGVGAVAISIAFLATMFGAILYTGSGAFIQHQVGLDITFGPQFFTSHNLREADYDGLLKSTLRAMFPEVKGRRQKRGLYKLVSVGAVYRLQDMVQEAPSLIGKSRKVWVPLSDEADMFLKGHDDPQLSEDERILNDHQVSWLRQLREQGRVVSAFNWDFFNSGDSREPELAGIKGAAVGSFYLLFITLIISFPVGVAAAVYLEEFAPKNRLTDIIEVNINNLAAVPSVIFGLLGLALFLNIFGMPRSSPLTGGLVMTLMTLPTIIITSRIALQSVPPSIREAALGIGASRMQAIFHHVLPQALPGVLTGTIIGMARALGESAPLLMIGMVAFIADIPSKLTEPACALPIQIYLWADSPERAFMEKTAGAIIVLLAFLILMNGTAVILRNRFSKP